MKQRPIQKAKRRASIVVALVAVGCGGGLGPDDLSRTEVAAGNGRIATVGTATDVPPAVRALSVDGLPIPGVSVVFTLESGGGSLTGSPATTNAEGVATLGSWTLGPTAGQNTLTASAGSQSLTFEAIGLVGIAASIERIDGDNQISTAGRPVPITPQVRVTDEFGNVIENETVTFAVVGPEGSIDPATSSTDIDGLASAGSWILGPTPGTNQLSATAGTGSATFSASGVPGPFSIAIAAGDSQVAVVDQPVAVNPQVLISDAQGLPVANAPVGFVVFIGGGSVAMDSSMTDINGLASVLWTLGTISGGNTLSAVLNGIGSSQFNATGGPDLPISLAVVRGDNQTAAINTTVPFAPTVVVRDQFGNPVPGVTVTFTVLGGGGALIDSVAISDSLGIARPSSWTVGSAFGINTVEASITGATLIFTANALSDVFDIDLVRTGGGGVAVTNSINIAVARWQNFIIGDLPDVDFSINPLAAGTCGAGTPDIADVVDDLRILMRIESIDGPGSILGSAGPCVIRDSADGGTTVIGRMRFDIDDLSNLAASGILTDVMIHEIGHVVGIGTLWDDFGFLQNPSLPTNSGADTHFTGPLAIAAFDSIGGINFQGSKVPVENTRGGQGTRDSHWRESILNNEAMTGFIDQGGNPFSLLSIQSVADLGYVVSPGHADPYTIPIAAPGIVATPGTVQIELINDVDRGPVIVVTRDGRITKVFRPR